MNTEIEAQGTAIRVLDTGAAKSANFARATNIVTITEADHGRKVGERIKALTGLVGLFTVASIAEGSFTVASTGADATSAPLTYKPFLEIDATQFSGPGGSAAVIDATTLRSTAKQKRMGLQDNGQMGFTVYFNPKNPAHQVLRGLKASRKLGEFEMEFSDEDQTKWGYGGYVLSVPVSGAVDGLVESQISVEIAGDITEY